MFKHVIKEEYKVPADLDYLGEMRDFVTRIGRKYGVSERIINAFKLAIDEAGTNIIRHAYRDWEGFITIQMIIRDKNVTVALIDQGHTFNPNNVRDPDLQRYVDIGKKGGLGIFIIRRVIDEIDYRKTIHGNELRLTKHRDVSPRKRWRVDELSFTMKTRFSLIASGILTCFVLAGFVWSTIRQGKKIWEENLSVGRTIAKSMANVCPDHLVEENTPELVTISADAQRENAPLVAEAMIVDTLGRIHALRRDLFLTTFVLPSDAVERKAGVFEYTMPGIGAVYDVVEDVIPEASEVRRPVGTIHLLLDKTVVDGEIASGRERVFFISAAILIVGYLGIFLLVYVTMRSFKKLSKWVRALGRGEAQDEIEFDASDEVGEIAQAFSEITEKFRKSQENLAEQERLQKEMQVAQEIQQTLLPAAFPEIEGYEIASYYEAAKEVGGDYFDFVEVDKDTLGIVVADVSGKGVPGSLVMTMIRTALRTEARGNKNAADVLTRVNDFVINDMKRGMFVTVFYVILDSKNRMINYASAGHNPMILYRGGTKKSYYLNPRGFPIGINLPDSALFRQSIQSDTLRLRPEDVLIIYTDGITEAMNPMRDRFGDERFLQTIRDYADLNVDPLVDRIRDEINVFTEGFSQSDDITLVAIREKMKVEDVLFNLRTRLMHMVDKEGMSVKEACRVSGVSTSTYYKYKKRFKKMGAAGLKEKITRSEIEEKHISIEEKAKMFGIIKEHPEYGAKRISEELNTEKYGFTVMDEKKIYDELVRSRLNTKELRMAFIERGGKGKKMKPPGTPFLTLDGQVIVESKILRESTVEKTPPVPIEEEAFTQRDGEEEGVLAADSVKEKTDVFEDLMPADEWVEDGKEIESEKEDAFVLEGFGKGVELPHPWNPKKLNSEEEGLMIVMEEVENEDVSEEMNDDEMFHELITDVFDIAEDEQMVDVKDEGRPTLDQILEIEDEAIFDIGAGDMFEDRIAASVAGELFGEEIGKAEGRDIGESTVIFRESGLYGGSEQSERETIEGLSDSLETEIEESTGALERDKEIKFLEIGREFYQRGDYARAVEEFQKTVEDYPNFIEARQYLGDTFFRMGQMDKAREVYDMVRQLDPENVNVLENLGVIFANRGDYKKAVWQWGEVLKHNPDRRDIIARIKKMQRVIRQRYL
ncbi:MAG: SpoIIE family protein phosphatase [bacterium]